VLELGLSSGLCTGNPSVGIAAGGDTTGKTIAFGGVDPFLALRLWLNAWFSAVFFSVVLGVNGATFGAVSTVESVSTDGELAVNFCSVVVLVGVVPENPNQVRLATPSSAPRPSDHQKIGLRLFLRNSFSTPSHTKGGGCTEALLSLSWNILSISFILLIILDNILYRFIDFKYLDIINYRNERRYFSARRAIFKADSGTI
jgi:hypothetical protein